MVRTRLRVASASWYLRFVVVNTAGPCSPQELHVEAVSVASGGSEAGSSVELGDEWVVVEGSWGSGPRPQPGPRSASSSAPVLQHTSGRLQRAEVPAESWPEPPAAKGPAQDPPSAGLLAVAEAVDLSPSFMNSTSTFLNPPCRATAPGAAAGSSSASDINRSVQIHLETTNETDPDEGSGTCTSPELSKSESLKSEKSDVGSASEAGSVKEEGHSHTEVLAAAAAPSSTAAGGGGAVGDDVHIPQRDVGNETEPDTCSSHELSSEDHNKSPRQLLRMEEDWVEEDAPGHVADEDPGHFSGYAPRHVADDDPRHVTNDSGHVSGDLREESRDGGSTADEFEVSGPWQRQLAGGLDTNPPAVASSRYHGASAAATAEEEAEEVLRRKVATPKVADHFALRGFVVMGDGGEREASDPSGELFPSEQDVPMEPSKTASGEPEEGEERAGPPARMELDEGFLQRAGEVSAGSTAAVAGQDGAEEDDIVLEGMPPEDDEEADHTSGSQTTSEESSSPASDDMIQIYFPSRGLSQRDTTNLRRLHKQIDDKFWHRQYHVGVEEGEERHSAAPRLGRKACAAAVTLGVFWLLSLLPMTGYFNVEKLGQHFVSEWDSTASSFYGRSIPIGSSVVRRPDLLTQVLGNVPKELLDLQLDLPRWEVGRTRTTSGGMDLLGDEGPSQSPYWREMQVEGYNDMLERAQQDLVLEQASRQQASSADQTFSTAPDEERATAVVADIGKSPAAPARADLKPHPARPQLQVATAADDSPLARWTGEALSILRALEREGLTHFSFLQDVLWFERKAPSFFSEDFSAKSTASAEGVRMRARKELKRITREGLWRLQESGGGLAPGADRAVSSYLAYVAESETRGARHVNEYRRAAPKERAMEDCLRMRGYARPCADHVPRWMDELTTLPALHELVRATRGVVRNLRDMVGTELNWDEDRPLIDALHRALFAEPFFYSATSLTLPERRALVETLQYLRLWVLPNFAQPERLASLLPLKNLSASAGGGVASHDTEQCTPLEEIVSAQVDDKRGGGNQSLVFGKPQLRRKRGVRMPRELQRFPQCDLDADFCDNTTGASEPELPGAHLHMGRMDKGKKAPDIEASAGSSGGELPPVSRVESAAEPPEQDEGDFYLTDCKTSGFITTTSGQKIPFRGLCTPRRAARDLRGVQRARASDAAEPRADARAEAPEQVPRSNVSTGAGVASRLSAGSSSKPFWEQFAQKCAADADICDATTEGMQMPAEGGTDNSSGGSSSKPFWERFEQKCAADADMCDATTEGMRMPAEGGTNSSAGSARREQRDEGQKTAEVQGTPVQAPSRISPQEKSSSRAAQRLNMSSVGAFSPFFEQVGTAWSSYHVPGLAVDPPAVLDTPSPSPAINHAGLNHSPAAAETPRRAPWDDLDAAASNGGGSGHTMREDDYDPSRAQFPLPTGSRPVVSLPTPPPGAAASKSIKKPEYPEITSTPIGSAFVVLEDKTRQFRLQPAVVPQLDVQGVAQRGLSSVGGGEKYRYPELLASTPILRTDVGKEDARRLEQYAATTSSATSAPSTQSSGLQKWRFALDISLGLEQSLLKPGRPAPSLPEGAAASDLVPGMRREAQNSEQQKIATEPVVPTREKAQPQERMALLARDGRRFSQEGVQELTDGFQRPAGFDDNLRDLGLVPPRLPSELEQAAQGAAARGAAVGGARVPTSGSRLVFANVPDQGDARRNPVAPVDPPRARSAGASHVPLLRAQPRSAESRAVGSSSGSRTATPERRLEQGLRDFKEPIVVGGAPVPWDAKTDEYLTKIERFRMPRKPKSKKNRAQSAPPPRKQSQVRDDSQRRKLKAAETIELASQMDRFFVEQQQRDSEKRDSEKDEEWEQQFM